MSIDKKAINYYYSFFEVSKELNQKQFYEFNMAIFEVMFFDKHIDEISFTDSMLNILWKSVKHSIQASVKGYCDKKSIAYDDVFAPLDNPLSNPLNNKHKGQEKGQEKEKGQVVVRFAKPTLDDLQNRISEMNYQVDAVKFFNYYESNGWKVGRNKMKCWKSALTTWNSNNDTKQQSQLKSFKQQDKEAIDSSIDNYYRMKEQGFNLQEELIKQAELEKKGNTYELN